MSLFSIIEISLQWQPAPHLFAFDYQHIHYLVYVKCMHFPGLFTDFIGKPSLFLYGSLGRSKTLLIFSKFKLIGKLKRNPLNFLVKKTYLQAFLQQLRQQSYYDYQ